PTLACREVELELGARLSQFRRLRREADARSSRDTVQGGIFERHLARPDDARLHRAAARAPIAADLEQIGEIRGEVHRQAERAPALRIAGDREEFVAARLPQ